jgi:hypothetical protein
MPDLNCFAVEAAMNSVREHRAQHGRGCSGLSAPSFYLCLRFPYHARHTVLTHLGEVAMPQVLAEEIR